MAQEDVHECRTRSPYLIKGEGDSSTYEYDPHDPEQIVARYKDVTIPQLVKKIRDDLRKEATLGPIRAEDAVKKFQEGLAFIEKEYDTIPQIIEEYDKAHDGFEEPGEMYCTAERQWKAIKDFVKYATEIVTVDPPIRLEDNIKYAIEELRDPKYVTDLEVKKAEEEGGSSQYSDHSYTKFKKAVKSFRSIKTCLDRRTEEEELITNRYITNKEFKKTAEGYFSEMKELYDIASDYSNKKKYKALYATYLEANWVWEKIKSLSPKGDDPPPDPKITEWLRRRLTVGLKQSLFAKHELFCWHDDWLKKQLAVGVKKAANDEFLSNRRKNFTREAEDVQPQTRPPEPEDQSAVETPVVPPTLPSVVPSDTSAEVSAETSTPSEATSEATPEAPQRSSRKSSAKRGSQRNS